MQHYNYFKNYYKIIAIDLSKQQALDADPKTIQQINFKGNLARDEIENMTCFLLLKKQKNILEFLEFLQGTVTILQFYLDLI